MNKLILGDCLEKLKIISDNSISLCLTDPPYGITNAIWDNSLNFNTIWPLLDKIMVENGVIALFGFEPFSSYLRLSNIKNYKYDFVWLKDNPSGFLNAKKRPLTCHEFIHIFYKTQPNYYPQFWQSKPMNTVYESGNDTNIYNKSIPQQRLKQNIIQRYPLSYLKMNTVNGRSKEKVAHLTQKPVQLLEYLIKTYTNEEDTILDFCMGSGTTGVAAKNLNRNFIGIEINEEYFNIAKERIYGKQSSN